jgi:hypothetical protein
MLRLTEGSRVVITKIGGVASPSFSRSLLNVNIKFVGIKSCEHKILLQDENSFGSLSAEGKRLLGCQAIPHQGR